MLSTVSASNRVADVDIARIDSKDIRALTWYAWRTGVLDTACPSFAQLATASLEQFVRGNPMIGNEYLPGFFEETQPRAGEFLIEFSLLSESSGDVSCVLTSQRLWLFDMDLSQLATFELAKIKSYRSKFRLTHDKVVIETEDGIVKSIRAWGPDDTDAVNLAIEKCKNQPWSIRLDEQSWAALANELLEPDPNPAGIGVSPAVDTLIAHLADDEEWLYAGLATWTTTSTEATTVFQRWLNRVFLGVLGDALTPKRGKFGITAFARSGNLYIATLGDYVDGAALDALISNATIDKASVQSQHISDISISAEEDRLLLSTDKISSTLDFPDCFHPGNPQIPAEIHRAKASAWKYPKSH